MDKTLGSAALIDSSNIELLLDEMKKAQIAEHEKEAETRLEAARTEASKRQRALTKELAQVERDSQTHAKQVEEQRQIIRSIEDRALEVANGKIRSSRRYGLAFAILAFLTMSIIPLFGDLGGPYVSATLFVITIGLGLLFQFSDVLRNRFFDPFFRRRDHRILEKTCSHFGLASSDVLQTVKYTGDTFERL